MNDVNMTLRMNGVRFLVAAAAGALALGCSSGDESGGSESSGANVDTGFPPSQELSGLSETDAQEICGEAVQQTFLGVGKDLCLVEGLFSASFSFFFNEDIAEARTECSESVSVCEQCLDDPTGAECSTDGAVEVEDTDECVAQIRECDATIQVFEVCLNGIQDLFLEALAEVPQCSERKESDFDSSEEATADQELDFEDVPACAEIEAACPGTLE